MRRTHRRLWLGIALLLVVAVGGLFFLQSAIQSADSVSDEGGADGSLTPREPETPPAAPEPLLRGRLVNAASGAGIGRVRVTATCGGAEEPLTATLTRATGDFAFKELPAGPCVIAAGGEEWVASGPDPVATHPVTIDPERPLRGVELQVFAAGTLSGRVARDGEGVAGVTLTVLYLEAPDADEAFAMSIDVRSGRDGAFLLPHLGPGRVRVLAEHDDYGVAESASRFLHAGEHVRGVDIELGQSGVVSGRVLGPGARPRSGAVVRLRRTDTLHRVQTETDAAGAFEFPAVRVGAVIVETEPYGFRLARAEVDVAAQEVAQVELRLSARDGFGGVVTAPDGSPVPGATILVQPAGQPDAQPRLVAHAGADGRFWVDVPPPPPALVFARAVKYAASDKQALAGNETDLELTLGQGGALVGEVVDELGNPVPWFAVRIPGIDREIVVEGGRLRFEFPTLEPGRYHLQVRGRSRPAVLTHRLLVVAGDTTDAGRIVLGRGGAVVGRVLDAATGEPLGGVAVNLEDDSGRTTTDAAGMFRIEGLSTTARSAWLRRNGYARRVVSGLAPGPGLEVDLGDIALSATRDGGPALQYSGIGIQVQVQEDRLIVGHAFEGGSADRLGGFSHGRGILAVGLVVGVVEFGLSQDLREHRHDLRLVKHHLGLAAKLRG